MCVCVSVRPGHTLSTHTKHTLSTHQELTLFIKKLEQKRHKFSTFRPDFEYFDQTAQNKKSTKTSSLREILILCYFLALVCVELSLIVVLDISHDRGF